MEHSTEQFLQKVFAALEQDLSSNSLINPSLLTPYEDSNNVDTFVELEMQRIRRTCSHKEQQYVENMLLENPIKSDRRPYTSQNCLHPQELKQQPCCRAHYNNKIKKTTSKYRHKFISRQLIQTFDSFECIQDLIKTAEHHVLKQGMSIHKLQNIRNTYGVDSSLHHVRDLEDMMPGELSND